jgi:flagellar basal body-associated protein FliL
MKQLATLLIVALIVLLMVVYLVLPAFGMLANNPGQTVRTTYAETVAIQDQAKENVEKCNADPMGCVAGLFK